MRPGKQLVTGDAQRFGGGPFGGARRIQFGAQGDQRRQVVLDLLKGCQYRLPIGRDTLVVPGDRLRFLRLGGTHRDMIGAYQGQFIFIDRGGVKFGKTLTGQRFFALTRTGDGRLAIPGAIQREIDGRPVAVAP